jgi:hypothetical protein
MEDREVLSPDTECGETIRSEAWQQYNFSDHPCTSYIAATAKFESRDWKCSGDIGQLVSFHC